MLVDLAVVLDHQVIQVDLQDVTPAGTKGAGNTPPVSLTSQGSNPGGAAWDTRILTWK